MNPETPPTEALADIPVDEIVSRYGDTIYKLAFFQMRNRPDADDIFQEVFFRYIRRKPVFENEVHRKAWFIRVTINCCKNAQTSGWRKKTVPLEDTIVFEQPAENELFETLQKLPVKYRGIIHLFYYEDMSINEICRVLNKKPSAVKMQLARARRKLKEILKEESDV